VPERPWAVRDRIPLNNVTLFSGEGAIGKTILSLQLAVATVLGRDWLKALPEPGPVVAVCCEDDPDELHRRLDAILRHYQASFADLAGLHLISLAGQDALLATPRRDGLLQPTRLFKQLGEAAADLKPTTRRTSSVVTKTTARKCASSSACSAVSPCSLTPARC
jgi:RecA-family ATPase